MLSKTKNNSMGRPKNAEQKTTAVFVLSKELKAKLIRKANESGMTLSKFICEFLAKNI